MEEDVAATFLSLPISSPVLVKSIGLGTSGQSSAEFRLWSREGWHNFITVRFQTKPNTIFIKTGFGIGFHEVFQLDVPKYTIPDSVRGRASIIGNVMFVYSYICNNKSQSGIGVSVYRQREILVFYFWKIESLIFVYTQLHCSLLMIRDSNCYGHWWDVI